MVLTLTPVAAMDLGCAILMGTLMCLLKGHQGMHVPFQNSCLISRRDRGNRS